MCYDINFTVSIKELADYFPEMVFDAQIEMDFNAGIHILGHAFGNHPMIYARQDDASLRCRLMEWGLIPHTTTDEKKFAPHRKLWLNARSEKVLDDTRSYWYKIKDRRCLLPITGFYEHRAIEGWKKKVPYLIRVEDQPLFFLPCLYAVTELPDRETGEVIKRWTFAILTRSAVGNQVMMNIHNDGENRHRMPLILPFDLSKEFVQKDLTPDRYRAILNFQMPAGNLCYDTVYSIRSPKLRPDSKEKNEHWEWENLPPLGVGNP